jgi:hypothetical protein
LPIACCCDNTTLRRPNFSFGIDGCQAGGVASNLRPYLAGMLARSCGILCRSGGCCRAIKTGDRSLYLIVTAAVVGLSALLLAIFTVAAHFPFWGRHLAPVFPGVVIMGAISLASISSRQWVEPAVATVLCVTLALSSWELRFAAQHKKDDHRYVVQRAAVALSSGSRVWWLADVWASRYYGDDVTTADPWASNMFIRPDGFSGRYEGLPQPDGIVLSKPDIYDKNGTLREFIRKSRIPPVRPSTGI